MGAARAARRSRESPTFRVAFQVYNYTMTTLRVAKHQSFGNNPSVSRYSRILVFETDVSNCPGEPVEGDEKEVDGEVEDW